MGMGDVFKALADPTRRKILDELADRDGRTLFEICNRLIMRHQISSSRQAISQHLDLLEAAGLVHTRAGMAATSSTTSTRRRWTASRSGGAQRRRNEDQPRQRLRRRSRQGAQLCYTETLGFVKKTEMPVGEVQVAHGRFAGRPRRSRARAGTIRPPRGEAVQGRSSSPTAFPYTSFAVGDVQAEYERLSARGVKFVQEPTSMGSVTTAVFDDTCGNLIQIAAMN